MAGNNNRSRRFFVLLLILLFILQACATTASAADPEMLSILPREWILTDELQEAEGEPQEADLAFLTLEDDGTSSLTCDGKDGGYAYSCEGTWAFELVVDGNDLLTLRFTSTDDPSQAENDYSVECVYDAYTESWVENDTLYTYLILTEISTDGITPFQDVYGYNDLALHNEQGPNMKIGNCKEWVSLREARSMSAKRIMKVPLGAPVLAFPQSTDDDGFVYCVYQDNEGFILAQYLIPID